MYLEYIATIVRFEAPARPPMLATYAVGDQRFAVEVPSVKDAVQIERLIKAAVGAAAAASHRAQPRTESAR